MTGPEIFKPKGTFEETEESETEENAIDPEESQFKFTTEKEREKALKKMVLDEDARERMPQDVKDLLLKGKEEEIREKQNEEKRREEKKLKDEEELQ